MQGKSESFSLDSLVTLAHRAGLRASIELSKSRRKDTQGLSVEPWIRPNVPDQLRRRVLPRQHLFVSSRVTRHIAIPQDAQQHLWCPFELDGKCVLGTSNGGTE